MWSVEKKGIVTTIRNGSCIVVDPDGVYEKITLPSADVTVGSEVTYYRTRFPGVTKPLLLAASFLLLFGFVVLWQQAELKPVAAYITLDLNPSVEISVDKANLVKDVRCLDEETIKFKDTDNLKGQKLDYAIRSLIDEAIELNYLKPGADNLIISTVCPANEAVSPVDAEMVRSAINRSLSEHDYVGRIAVYTASQEMHDAAQDLEISMGKYVIYRQLIAEGEKVTIEDMRNNKLGQIVSSYRMALPQGEKGEAKNNGSANNNSNAGNRNDDSLDPSKKQDQNGNAGIVKTGEVSEVPWEKNVRNPNADRIKKGNWAHLPDFIANMVKDD